MVPDYVIQSKVILPTSKLSWLQNEMVFYYVIQREVILPISLVQLITGWKGVWLCNTEWSNITHQSSSTELISRHIHLMLKVLDITCPWDVFGQTFGCLPTTFTNCTNRSGQISSFSFLKLHTSVKFHKNLWEYSPSYFTGHFLGIHHQNEWYNICFLKI